MHLSSFAAALITVCQQQALRLDLSKELQWDAVRCKTLQSCCLGPACMHDQTGRQRLPCTFAMAGQLQHAARVSLQASQGLAGVQT